MSGLIDQIEPLLVDGFELRFARPGAGKGIWKLYKNDREYLEGGFKHVTINDSMDGFNYRRKIMSKLERIGAIKPTIKGKPKEREPVVRHMPTKSDLQIALERAQNTLKDPKADPTARGHARDYIKLARLYVKLAKRLRQHPVPESPTRASDEH